MIRKLMTAGMAVALSAGGAASAMAHGVEPTARPLTKAEHEEDRAV
jgi:hypothetical protein